MLPTRSLPWGSPPGAPAEGRGWEAACDVLRGSEPAAAGLRRCQTAELTVLLTRGAPAAPTVKNTPAGLCVPGHVTSRAHKQIPSLEVTQTRAIPALSCLGTSRSTAGHLGPAPPCRTHARGSTSLMEQLKTGVWAGTDPSKEHLPSPPPRTPGYITQDQAEMIVCRSKSISHIWRAGDDSAAKPAAVSK